MKWITRMKPLVALMLCATICLGPGVKTGTAAPGKEQGATASAIIQAVQARGEGEKTELVIDVSAPATYTSYKTAAPQRLVVDFSQVVPADSLADLKLSKGPVKGITLKRFDTDAGVLTRMEIFLDQNIDPVITPSTEKIGELRISFPGYIPPAVVKAESPVVTPAEQPLQPVAALPPAEKAEAVQTTPELQKPAIEQPVTSTDLPVVTNIVSNAGGIDILVSAAVNDYKTFRLNKPERIVIDIPGVRLAMADKLVQLNTSGVSSARIASHADKVRVVLDAVNGTLPDATIEKTATGLHIFFPAANAVVKPVVAPVPMPIVAPASVPAPTPAPAPEKKAASAVPAEPAVTATAAVSAPKVASQVEAIDFQALDTLSRVMVRLNGTPVVENPVKTPGSISFRIKNVGLSRSLQRSFETAKFITPVLRVTPVLVKTKAGNDVLVRLTMKEDAPFELRRETDVIYLDIKLPADMIKPDKPQEAKKAEAQKAAPVAAKVAVAPVAVKEPQLDKIAEKTQVTGKREYTGRKVTLEFADAEVRKIFQLLSEVSNKNFVLGDEVGGNISLKLVNVPWDQALDIILDTKGLDKREDGTIVLIRGKGKFKSLMDEEIEVRKATLKGEPLETTMFDINYADLGSVVTQFTALKTDRGMITQDQRTNKIIVKDVKAAIEDMRTILKSLDIPEKQVMIEARIVEASSTFTQSLGVNWGIHYRDGSASIAGINAFDTNFGGLADTAPSTSGTTGTVKGATAGISFGTLASNIKLDLRLNAAVSAGLARVVSTPRVATLNHKSAKITQGQQIPYTSSTSDKIETKFIEAALSLEVTPHINPNGTIVMKIDAKNDSPGTGSPPPINKKQATTEMMLRDGETTVIGGIYVERENSGEDGVPLMKDVPWLGNLFKSTDTRRSRDELLIFITPRIITGSN
jgi:type IV pilus assembly protein PilQ